MTREQIEKEIDVRLEEPDNEWDVIFNRGYSRGFRDGAQWMADRLCIIPWEKALKELHDYWMEKKGEKKNEKKRDNSNGDD